MIGGGGGGCGAWRRLSIEGLWGRCDWCGDSWTEEVGSFPLGEDLESYLSRSC